MARLKKINKDVWLTVITRADLKKTQSQLSDVEDFEKHLAGAYFSGRPLILLLENENKFELKIFGDKNVLADKITAGIVEAESLRDVYRKIVEKLSNLE